MVIWGDKIGLRRFEDHLTPFDMQRLYEWSQDDELLRWSGGTPAQMGFEEFEDQVVQEQLYGPHNRRAFFIIRRDTHELIGRLGLFAIDWGKRQAELGIIIGQKEYWGRGYGRDALRTFLHHIFKTSNLERVYLFTFQDNVRAQRAFAASGFRPVRSVRRTLPDLGEFDGLEMEATRAEFMKELERARNLES